MRTFEHDNLIAPTTGLTCTAYDASGNTLGSAAGTAISGQKFRATIAAITPNQFGYVVWTDGGVDIPGGMESFHPIVNVDSSGNPTATTLADGGAGLKQLPL